LDFGFSGLPANKADNVGQADLAEALNTTVEGTYDANEFSLPFAAQIERYAVAAGPHTKLCRPCYGLVAAAQATDEVERWNYGDHRAA